MKLFKSLFLVGILSALLLLSGCIANDASESTNESTANSQAEQDVEEEMQVEKLEEIGGFGFKELEHDFGVVKQSAGIISYDFEFSYVGEDPITVTAVPASCACTSAEISMSEFKKGDKGVLTVKFDPNLHEEPKGKFFKTVTLLTEPKLEKQPEVKIWAEMDLDLGPEAYKLKEHKD